MLHNKNKLLVTLNDTLDMNILIEQHLNLLVFFPLLSPNDLNSLGWWCVCNVITQFILDCKWFRYTISMCSYEVPSPINSPLPVAPIPLHILGVDWYPTLGWEGHNILIEKMRDVSVQKLLKQKNHIESHLASLTGGSLWVLVSGHWRRHVQIPTVGWDISGQAGRGVTF